jgi:hypothetical protein
VYNTQLHILTYADEKTLELEPIKTDAFQKLIIIYNINATCFRVGVDNQLRQQEIGSLFHFALPVTGADV